MAVEFRSGLDHAWYDVLMAKDGCDLLRVKFVGFGDDHDEVYEVSELSSFNEIDEFRTRSASLPLPPLIRRRFLSSTTTNVSKKWAVKEVTKSNFSESLEEFKNHLPRSDFVAVSLQKPSHSTPSTRRNVRLITPSRVDQTSAGICCSGNKLQALCLLNI